MRKINFSVYKDQIRRQQWEEALDQDLKKRAVVCEHHFDPKDVCKTFLVPGVQFELQKQKCSLVKSAVPRRIIPRVSIPTVAIVKLKLADD